MTQTNLAPAEAALCVLPDHIAEALRATAALYGGVFHEIRLYREGYTAMVYRGKTVRTKAFCPSQDFDDTVFRLCGKSLYAHGDTIREGYIYTESGLRVGVCGRAVTENGRIRLACDLTSLCIRIPTRIPGAAKNILPYIWGADGIRGMLIYSPPGVGKTTVLRELAAELRESSRPLRCAVVDTRFELTAGICCDGLDVLRGYPRAIGMEIATRTMAPQIVICDEIATGEDADAVRSCVASGVAVVASCHAGSEADLTKRPEIGGLMRDGVFPTWVGLYREGDQVRHRIGGIGQAC